MEPPRFREFHYERLAGGGARTIGAGGLARMNRLPCGCGRGSRLEDMPEDVFHSLVITSDSSERIRLVSFGDSRAFEGPGAAGYSPPPDPANESLCRSRGLGVLSIGDYALLIAALCPAIEALQPGPPPGALPVPGTTYATSAMSEEEPLLLSDGPLGTLPAELPPGCYLSAWLLTGIDMHPASEEAATTSGDVAVIACRTWVLAGQPGALALLDEHLLVRPAPEGQALEMALPLAGVPMPRPGNAPLPADRGWDCVDHFFSSILPLGLGGSRQPFDPALPAPPQPPLSMLHIPALRGDPLLVTGDPEQRALRLLATLLLAPGPSAVVESIANWASCGNAIHPFAVARLCLDSGGVLFCVTSVEGHVLLVQALPPAAGLATGPLPWTDDLVHLDGAVSLCRFVQDTPVGYHNHLLSQSPLSERTARGPPSGPLAAHLVIGSTVEGLLVYRDVERAGLSCPVVLDDGRLGDGQRSPSGAFSLGGDSGSLHARQPPIAASVPLCHLYLPAVEVDEGGLQGRTASPLLCLGLLREFPAPGSAPLLGVLLVGTYCGRILVFRHTLSQGDSGMAFSHSVDLGWPLYGISTPLLVRTLGRPARQLPSLYILSLNGVSCFKLSEKSSQSKEERFRQARYAGELLRRIRALHRQLKSTSELVAEPQTP
ncbi:hypothetical protein H696_03934 [Fonticula alba]|uniref:Uncharacterized protein n=1 Tax=Fonticula alba TaxID=691883 RepID=A0A058Z6I7_FONAL|nr:hypothetical protein H696_03934 [Fonticula alba]KCV69513.1 hypothetical protein H696_03934 [Fonticula alba]|eukprot:XP_009496078.1 hypothetical protein H696_03934 [Fonticula alba]